MVQWITILIIAAILVTLDKGLTAFNIMSLEKNYPKINPYSVEKNPIARASFEKFGLFGGTLIYWVLSLITFLFAVYLFKYPASVFAPNNALGVSLYVVMMLYSLVIFNNVYFCLKYNNLI